MKIIVDGRTAAIKKGTKIDFIAENRRFTGADSYTLNIAFPLKGCPQNIAIFGHIERMDIEKEAVYLDAEICAGRFRCRGVVTPTEVNEMEVKCQFLEGRCVRNFRDDFGSVYIDTLDVYPCIESGNGQVVPNTAAKMYEELTVHDDSSFFSTRDFYLNPTFVHRVALTWINNSSGNAQNTWMSSFAAPKAGTKIELSFMMYLIDVFRSVCLGMGYQCDASAWADNPRKDLLMVNTLPAAWGITEFRRALPHWTVEEFFEQLEWFLDAEIDIDYNARKVTMLFASQYYEHFGEMVLDEVVNEYSATVEQDNNLEYTDNINIAYDSADTTIDAYRSNMWFTQAVKNGNVTVSTYDRIFSVPTGLQSPCKDVMYIAEIDRYFVWRRIVAFPAGTKSYSYPQDWWNYVTLQEVNQFAPYIGNPDSSEIKRSLSIVPAWVESVGTPTDGVAIFLAPGELEDTDAGKLQWNGAEQIETLGGGEEQTGFYSKIFVAYWQGNTTVRGKYNTRPTLGDNEFVGCEMEGSTLKPMFAYTPVPSLRLADRKPMSRIIPTTKYTISFLAKELPDPRSVYYIRGKKFICAKLTATITENGMSEKIKGEFYLVKE